MRRLVEILILLAVLAVFVYLAKEKLEAFFYNQGNDYLEHSLYKEAIKSYDNALRINPQSWRAHFGLAEAYRDSRDYDRAAGEYNKVLAIDPLSIKTYQFLAEMYSQEGKHIEALNTAGRAREKIPDSKEIEQLSRDCCHSFISSTLNNGTELFLGGKYKEAISLLEDAIKLCPDSAIAQYTLGYYYFFAKDYDKAEASLRRALLLDPKLHYAHRLLSQIYFKKGNFEKEVSFAKEAFVLNNEDAVACNDLGLALMHLERYAEAIVYLKKAVSLDPRNPDYIYSLGSLYRDNKMFDQAISEYNKLSVLRDDYPNLHNDLADIYANLGDQAQSASEYQKEARYCRQGLKEHPDDPVLLNNYAYALSGLNELDKAKSITETLISSYPRYRQAYLTLSRINEKMDDKASALKALEQAKRLSSGEEFINKEISRVNDLPRAMTWSRPEGKDYVHLKNGRKIGGKIIRDEPDRVVLEVYLGESRGEVILYRDSIERIEKDQD